MTFICATNIKHISTDQIKTAFRFSFNTIKKCYVKSSGAMLNQHHANKQEDDFSSVLQQQYQQKVEFIRFVCARIAAVVDKINKIADC